MNYEQIEATGRLFQAQAEIADQLHKTMAAASNTVLNGPWDGEAADAYAAEAEGEALPALAALASALARGQTSLSEIGRLFREAEEGTRNQTGVANLSPLPAGYDQAVSSNQLGPSESGADQVSYAIEACVVRDPASIFKDPIHSDIVGARIPGSNSKALNGAMERLMENPSPAEVEGLLAIVANERGRPLGELQAEYKRFLEIRDRQRVTAEKLDFKSQWLDFTDYPDFAGSTTSLRYGKVVGDVFGIDPVFGSMLNPTGGIMGPGNSALPQPHPDHANAYHSIFHDAGGYLKKSYGLGPGYDYLGKESYWDPAHELTGQKSGLRYWADRIDSPGWDWPKERGAQKAMDAYIWYKGGRKINPEVLDV
ncbi:MAG: WXG100 family type VII secretion target [Chloroflexi bacterium]|nr:WXG100 family type VII secretion target [Chloroflexota bacterium]